MGWGQLAAAAYGIASGLDTARRSRRARREQRAEEERVRRANLLYAPFTGNKAEKVDVRRGMHWTEGLNKGLADGMAMAQGQAPSQTTVEQYNSGEAGQQKGQGTDTDTDTGLTSQSTGAGQGAGGSGKVAGQGAGGGKMDVVAMIKALAALFGGGGK